MGAFVLGPLTPEVSKQLPRGFGAWLPIQCPQKHLQGRFEHPPWRFPSLGAFTQTPDGHAGQFVSQPRLARSQGKGLSAMGQCPIKPGNRVS